MLVWLAAGAVLSHIVFPTDGRLQYGADTNNHHGTGFTSTIICRLYHSNLYLAATTTPAYFAHWLPPYSMPVTLWAFQDVTHNIMLFL